MEFAFLYIGAYLLVKAFLFSYKLHGWKCLDLFYFTKIVDHEKESEEESDPIQTKGVLNNN
jgi:hypothetical protein